jgi:light-regulated signal transduction histidine kinase (bacteriophytochrome)
MHLLIRDLLALSRAATTQIRYAPTDLNDVVTAVVDSLDSLVRERKAAISWDRLPQLPSDANRMHSLFLNLLTNAVKYNKSPIPKVHISSRTEGADYHFLVKDNGIGIESRFYERVFMPFQRLHTEQEYEGTGMGLALCRKIVELFGGKIWITPAVAAAGANAAVIAAAGGSIFHFTLPKPGTGLQGAAAPADSDSLS